MKDVVVKSLGGKLCYGIVSVNGKEYKVNSEFTLMAKIYNEMYDVDYTFYEIVKKYIETLSSINDKEKLEKLKVLIDAKTGNPCVS